MTILQQILLYFLIQVQKIEIIMYISYGTLPLLHHWSIQILSLTVSIYCLFIYLFFHSFYLYLHFYSLYQHLPSLCRQSYPFWWSCVFWEIDFICYGNIFNLYKYYFISYFLNFLSTVARCTFIHLLHMAAWYAIYFTHPLFLG